MPHSPVHAPLAQLDRASVYGTEGRAFESPAVHQKANESNPGVEF